MKNKPCLIDYFSDSDAISIDETDALEEQWMAYFCNYSNAEKASIDLDQFKWHTFSFQKYPSIDGREAEQTYKQHKARSYVVLPERSVRKNENAFVVSALPAVDLPCLPTDFYVFPKNMAWTMAFTHEQYWIGPFFAMHREYKERNRKNVEAYAALQEPWQHKPTQ